MFRSQWQEIEDGLMDAFNEMRHLVTERWSQKKASSFSFSATEVEKRKEDFEKWGREYVQKLKEKAGSERVSQAKENFFVLVRNLGINDELLRETFVQNKKEFLDPMVGEAIAVVALVLGWQKKDKETFSQALGEIGVVGVFAAKPFLCLIAICGLAYGYHRNFHVESFKKGSVLGLAGLTAAALTPGGFVGLLAAIVTMVYLNKKLSVEKPIEGQLKEIFQQIRSGDFFSEVRGSWKNLENFLSRLFQKDQQQGLTPAN